jgi:predicted ribosomally synthesized peptide with SipW-like signal peptide
MKITKSKVLVIALAVCLIAVMSFGTLAWFTDEKSVDNIFKVTTDDDNTTPDFDLGLYESVADEEGATSSFTTTGNTYENLQPGDVLTKNPTVVNEGSYNQYVRVYVTITKANVLVPALVRHGLDLEDVFGGYNADPNVQWISEIVDDDYTDGEVTNVYYLDKVLEPGEAATLFETVTIPGEFTKADMTFGGEFEINVVGQAIQSDNTGNNAKEAFLKW